jgi:lactoylglutathione lyase
VHIDLEEAPMKDEETTATSGASLRFIKLSTSDLDRAARFYSDVLGFVTRDRVSSGEGESLVEEIIMGSAGREDFSLILTRSAGSLPSGTGGTTIGFMVCDMADTHGRVLTAGGKVVQPISAAPELQLEIAFVEDAEGHLLQFVSSKKDGTESN